MMHVVPPRAAVALAVLCGLLLFTASCIVVNAPPADVRVDSGPPGPSEPPVASAPAVRYKPYAAALDRVLRQQATAENELRKRDWKELREEIEDWQKYARRLVGAADTSHDPARLRELCDQLLARLDTMHRAARGLDAATLEKALDETAPILNRLSIEFPLTEPTSQPTEAHAVMLDGAPKSKTQRNRRA